MPKGGEGGIIMIDEVFIRNGNVESGTIRFPEGLRVKVIIRCGADCEESSIYPDDFDRYYQPD